MFSTILNQLTNSTSNEEFADFSGQLAAISKTMGVIEFDLKGNILAVNDNFAAVTGYSVEEIVGNHHSMFADATYKASNEYKLFWDNLGQGESNAGQFKRIGKGGKEIWLEASYNPIFDADNKPFKVVKYATDITAAKLEAADFSGQLAAISKAMGVIEFDLKGNILAVNDNFAAVTGYSVEEIVGNHHSMFADATYKASNEYKLFWDNLGQGESNAGQFKRIGKGGKEIWLEASYNPIFDADNKPFKVVKYATDITAAKLEAADFSGQLAAISKAMGVIEFDLKGNILAVNDNFAAVTGYSVEEIVGNHHSMFADATYKASNEYKLFWDNLGQGESNAGQFKRIGKGGKEIWLEASYNPIFDADNKPFKVVKYATDITAAKLEAADFSGQLAAISKAMGVIEFDLKGNILAVNDNFAAVTGYSVEEIVGNHHSMFADATYKASNEYKLFWDNLGQGESNAGQFKRIGKGGKEIWLEASYNPIFDADNKPFKVVKYATDISEQKSAAESLNTAVEESQVVIEAAQSGDLTGRVPLEGKTGAIASLCGGVNALIGNMTEVLLSIREAGQTINTAAGEISIGNTDLSGRTEQQASSLEETASSMEELASTVKQNAENAKQANQLAAAASGVAVKGGDVVGEVVTTMSAINDSAQKIEDIITVIDGIAFQTNILALNAAVEAARAGEQGRGFAVVAGEVRTLAQRSASAAKEIKELITDSVTKTTEGTKLVENAGETMQEIVTSVQRVTDIMGEITAASSEQSTGIDQVNQAVTSMDETTQQNAALVEEAAAAAESLVNQSVSLMDTVNAFNLQGHSKKKERRATGSSMRAPSQPAAKSATTKAAAKTGTNDEWEAF